MERVQKDHKYQDHFACSSEYTIVCIDDRFRKPEQKYWGEDEIYKFIIKTLEGVNYCKEIIKKYFKKELVMSRE